MSFLTLLLSMHCANSNLPFHFSKVTFTDLFSTSKAPPSVLCFLVLGKYAANRRLKLEIWIVVLYLHDRSTKNNGKIGSERTGTLLFYYKCPWRLSSSARGRFYIPTPHLPQAYKELPGIHNSSASCCKAYWPYFSSITPVSSLDHHFHNNCTGSAG